MIAFAQTLQLNYASQNPMAINTSLPTLGNVVAQTPVSPSEELGSQGSNDDMPREDLPHPLINTHSSLDLETTSDLHVEIPYTLLILIMILATL